jgi:hypothetical protein
MTLCIGQWEVDADVEATRAVYRHTSRGSPGDCDCLYCRNFAALGDSAFPPSFLELANALGIDHRKAAEVYECGEFRDGRVDYGGWFHFVGTIKAGAMTATASGILAEWPWHRLTENFKIVLDRLRDIAFAEFDDYPLVRLVFDANVPWVVAEPYPQPFQIEKGNQ